MTSENELYSIIERFLPGECAHGSIALPYGRGHINDTYRVAASGREYILQRVNTSVFTDPDALSENIEAVSEWIRRKVSLLGGDPDREALKMLKCDDGKAYCRDSEGGVWRMRLFVKNTKSVDFVETLDQFCEIGRTFGNFRRQLSDFPVGTLHETIPNFHNTPLRFDAFRSALEADKFNRAHCVSREAEELLKREDFSKTLTSLEADGTLKASVTHNDTKVNNVLLDEKTGRGVCVIDLDTVMPGLSVNDFGDSIRSGTNTGAEDESDATRVSCSLELYRAYTEGFLAGTADELTNAEIENLHVGAMMMTYECALRFLTDYLSGDVYFKTSYDGQNLSRCRSQLALLSDMEKKSDKMLKIAREFA
ncbi:MAG: aminoglycoside phosphotransferase family protein [Firmicutes bacterium]|nr:aminoglycoside phosphotransferase family protein [Bacillota bacterium]